MPVSCSSSNHNRRFTVVYVEEAAFAFGLTRQILEKWPSCPVIPIRHYKDVFNRPHQNQRWQKDRQALILAVKDSPFLYPGPPICQRFGYERFFYTNFLLGCPFDCSYCYLQGLYPSAHMTAFVNVADFISAISNVAQAKPTYLALSHDADLLSLHQTIPYLDHLAGLFGNCPNLMAEVRTKSADRSFYLQNKPCRNLVFAYTLSPDPIIQKYERKTPSLQARLSAIKTAQERGFAIRLCFDPILADQKTKDCYEAFFKAVFQQIDPGGILDVSYGFFRMSDVLYRRIARHRPAEALFQGGCQSDDGIRTYAAATRQEMTEQHMAMIRQYVDPSRICLA